MIQIAMTKESVESLAASDRMFSIGKAHGLACAAQAVLDDTRASMNDVIFSERMRIVKQLTELARSERENYK